MELLARGKRGEIYLTKVNGHLVVLKKARKDSAAVHRMENEAKWLALVNTIGIGPKLIAFQNDALVMEYIDGVLFEDWYQHPTKKVLQNILQQCYQLDLLHVTKGELHRPTKNIIIRKGKPVLIDFERCRFDLQPKNVTQFAEFLVRHNHLKKKETRQLLQNYRKQPSKRIMQHLLRRMISP